MGRLIVLLAVLALAMALPASAGSPGALRVVQNNEMIYFEDYINATGTITLSGNYSINTDPISGVTTIAVAWNEGEHTFVDVDVKENP